MTEDVSNLTESPVSSEGKLKIIKRILPLLAILVAIGLGVFTGFYFSGKSGNVFFPGLGGIVSKDKIVKGSEFGSKDLSKFKDTAMGVLESGGLDGEGTHKLIREGGPSQTVYLTSSVLDLDQFVGRKIQIWGETFQAQKAGWLMDIGRVKILE
ncbi:hypothetical protein COT03_01835 [Candidatus Shapirobacteria bacterium CG07_land_8_20_14_0_80_39_18]|uniref:Uncharacterized protein n=1 Tax=Candidatus Shapirobacteria bacterium CG07_land_8_20_14_0_80_39_18 TaxID=1974882 RepID=A0A2M6YRC0_9BACT|nr:MAG: hypothetical protein COT03_01835 [Candidatus Shapirobacteria bacterium CG07_land_8_20_14_0_80_39_18]